MITVEEIREIAEGLFPDFEVRIQSEEVYGFVNSSTPLSYTHNRVCVINVENETGSYFIPDKDWRDTGLVLENLKANPRATSIEIIEDAVHVTIDDQGYVSGEGSTLQESICRAWLAVNKQGE